MPMVLGLCTSQTQKIFLAGFDGFESDSRKNNEVEKFLPSMLPEKLKKTSFNYPDNSPYKYSFKIMELDFLIVIPARYNSSRFQGTSCRYKGKSMIERV